MSANFLRLRKSGLFWGLMALSFCFGAVIAFNYYEMSQYESISLDGAFFVYPIFSALLISIFIPLFFGREHSDHAIRNKVAAGHSRAAIYAANLITGMAAALLFCTAYMAAVTAVGAPLVGFLEMEAGSAVFIVLGSFAAMAAFCALFTFATMLCGQKSLSAVICVLGVFLMLIASAYIKSKLDAHEHYLHYSLATDGGILPDGFAANPYYLSDTQYTAFKLLHNLLPSSHAVRYSSRQTQNLDTMPLYALTTFTLSTGLGLVLFQRKDLK